MIERIAATIARYRMFPSERPGPLTVGVAVSGGADSVALLHVLLELASRLNLQLRVLHVDHMLRGEESRADADFVRDLAARLCLVVHYCVADVNSLAAQTGDNLEQAARQARYGFFRKLREAGEVKVIAAGHTLSDQAETVLFRFLRGSGTAGLAGIRPVTEDGIVRPLIEIGRAEIEQFLRERSIPWREDSTNRSLNFARNRIRHELLPALARDWNPAIIQTLARTAAWAEAEESWWDQEITRLGSDLLDPQQTCLILNVTKLAGLHRAVARRLIRRAVEMVKGDLRSIGFEHIEAILALAAAGEGSGRLQVPGVDVYRSFDWLRLAPPCVDTLENRNFRLPAPVPGYVKVPGTNRIIHLELMAASNCSYNENVGRLDWERVSGSLELRNWRPGDQYRPAGYHSPEKIKTLFQQLRIPLWERRHWPIIISGDEILWARRFGPAAEYEADTACHSVLCIRESV